MLRARKKTRFVKHSFSWWHRGLFLFCCLFSATIFAKTWETLAPGMEYIDLRYHSISQWSHIHVFRIDLQTMRLSLVLAKNLPHHYASAQEFRRYGHGLLAINGGFFSPDKMPLGLRISDKQVLNPIRHISWWGVFLVTKQHAMITAPYDFQYKKNIEFAIQSGPRLLIAGQIPHLRPGYANRSALGLDAQGRVLILVTENLPLTTNSLAQIMKNSPLSCIDALNLDGGSSSQLYAKINDFNLDVAGFSQVSDAVLVKRR